MTFSIDVRVTLEGVDKILPEDLIQFSRYAINGASVFNGSNTTVFLLRMGEDLPTAPSDDDIRMMKMLMMAGNDNPASSNKDAGSSQNTPKESAEEPFQEGERVVTKGGHGDGVRDWEDLKQRHRDGGLRI